MKWVDKGNFVPQQSRRRRKGRGTSRSVPHKKRPIALVKWKIKVCPTRNKQMKRGKGETDRGNQRRRKRKTGFGYPARNNEDSIKKEQNRRFATGTVKKGNGGKVI